MNQKGIAAPPRGSALGYKLLELLFTVVGYRFVSFFAKFIVLYYFVALPGTVISSMRFYKVVFPQSSWLRRLGLTWKRFFSFATVFIDRFLIVHGQTERFELEHVGLDKIRDSYRQQQPLILWMSHLGNWELSSHLLEAEKIPLTLVLGKKQGERIEASQKEGLSRAQIDVVTVSDEQGLQTLELIDRLKSGAVVCIAGDRRFDLNQRSFKVSFFDRWCEVPLGPYVLASLTGAKIIPVFCLRRGPLSYRFFAADPLTVARVGRSERLAVMGRAAGQCFEELEKMVRLYPEQWYNFYDFWTEEQSVALDRE